MIDISRARFAYGSTVSVGWIPSTDDSSVRYAFAIRNKNDKHEKRTVRDLLCARLSTAKDEKFTFHAKPRYSEKIDRDFLGFSSTILSFLHRATSESDLSTSEIAALRGFIREMMKPEKPVNGAPREVFKSDNAKVDHYTTPVLVKPAAKPVAAPKYTREGEAVTFYHDREAGFSIGYAQRGDYIWFGLAVLSENDQFDKRKAREVILQSDGVKFGVGGNTVYPMPHHHVMHYISECINVYLQGRVDHMPEIQDLKRFRKTVLKNIGFGIARQYNPIAAALRSL